MTSFMIVCVYDVLRFTLDARTLRQDVHHLKEVARQNDAF